MLIQIIIILVIVIIIINPKLKEEIFSPQITFIIVISVAKVVERIHKKKQLGSLHLRQKEEMLLQLLPILIKLSLIIILLKEKIGKC